MITKQLRGQALQRQIDRVRRQLTQLQQLSNRLSTLRLLIFVGGVGLSSLAFLTVGMEWLWGGLLATTILFIAVVAYHQRIEQAILRYETWRQIKETHLARMNLNWEQLPAPQEIPPQERHPLEIDLDLAGERGLHRLLDVAIAPEGRGQLRQWLIAGEVDLLQVQERQALVAELRPRSLFRDKLTLASKLFRGRDAQAIASLLRPNDPALIASLRPWLILLGLAAAINLLLLLLNRLNLIGPIWQPAVLLFLVVGGLKGQQAGDVFKDAAALRDTLEQWLQVFLHLEKDRYTHAPHLRQLCAPFLDSQQRPSHYLQRASRIVNATGIRGNPIVWLLLNAFFPWDLFFLYRLELVKADLVRESPQWLSVWHTLEALSSLANWGYLNPDHPLPTIQPTADTPLTALGLGHPLIPDAEKVRNDFALAHTGQLYLITGSNMAGKSTFLRTIGLNLVLAYAGGPVDARSLTVVPGRLFTCIRVTDSLADGISYFYAEVQRLKALLDELARPHPFPLFFFVDEIFRGTNNRERLLGSQAMVRHLVERNGLGLIATHDLELVQLADNNPAIQNIHFREEVLNDQMVFDYRLRSGPCPTTNALKIMALAGLPVKP
ncbi:MAG: hypothetical protein IPL78_12280 [Chloroflexi bacterium]|nr:hypothetical protein [Chloroflexota bacterium]